MTVFFDEVKKYHPPLIQASMKKGLGELNFNLDGKKSAFIKVNIVRPAKPDSGIVTHHAVVEGLIHVLRESGISRITVAEGPAVGVNAEGAFRKSGYTELSKKMNIQLLNINESETCTKEWDNGVLELPSELFKSDLYINVIKMKTHFHTGVTLSIKNQQGLLTPRSKKENHCKYDLHKSLVSIAKVVQPDLIIVDAIHAMEGEGPTQGKKKHTNVIIYGKDMLETDIACCHFMGVVPTQIIHLNYAIQKSIGCSDPQIIGEAFDRHRTNFIMPSPKPKQILNFYSWKNYHACAEDEHSFDKAIHLALIRPKYWFTFFPKFLYFVLFNRFHLLRGKDAKIPEESGRILCIGNCCRDVARECDAEFVPGCPPQPKDILKTIERMK